jgi:hypothetical protein
MLFAIFKYLDNLAAHANQRNHAETTAPQNHQVIAATTTVIAISVAIS